MLNSERGPSPEEETISEAEQADRERRRKFVQEEIKRLPELAKNGEWSWVASMLMCFSPEKENLTGEEKTEFTEKIDEFESIFNSAKKGEEVLPSETGPGAEVEIVQIERSLERIKESL